MDRHLILTLVNAAMLIACLAFAFLPGRRLKADAKTARSYRLAALIFAAIFAANLIHRLSTNPWE